MKEYTKNLIYLYNKEKTEKNELNKEEKEKKETLLKRCNDYMENKKKECSLLNNLKILHFKKSYIFKLGIGLIVDVILSPFKVASLFLPFFINHSYNKLFNSILIDEDIIFSLGRQYGFDDKDLNEYDLKINLIEEGDEKGKKIKNEKESKNIDENKKEKANKEDNEINEKEKMMDKKNEDRNPFKKIIKSYLFFEKLFSYTGPIQCLIKAKELSRNYLIYSKN
jgi:hypothetical protein